MAHAQHIQDAQSRSAHIVPVKRSVLTPGLASAAKRFGIRPDAVKRYEEGVQQERQVDLHRLRLERDESKAKYEALRGTVDQLVLRIQDVAQAPSKAQAGDIQNIRVLLKQAIVAMERQQVELKGIRARTQRMERAALRADAVQQEFSQMKDEIFGYQKALHGARQDMADLIELVEGEGGLKDLAGQVREVRHDLDETRLRTSDLEAGAQDQVLRIEKLEFELETLRSQVQSNMTETAGVASALLILREEVQGLRKKVGRYIIDQMRFLREK
jgi:hypothetical protein